MVRVDDSLPAQLLASQESVRALQDAVHNGEQSASARRQEVTLMQVFATHTAFHAPLFLCLTRVRAEPARRGAAALPLAGKCRHARRV
jgi:hypothetical protein